MSCIVFPSIQQTKPSQNWISTEFSSASSQLQSWSPPQPTKNELQQWEMAPFSISNYTQLQTSFSKQKSNKNEVEANFFFGYHFQGLTSLSNFGSSKKHTSQKPCKLPFPFSGFAYGNEACGFQTYSCQENTTSELGKTHRKIYSPSSPRL